MAALPMVAMVATAAAGAVSAVGSIAAGNAQAAMAASRAAFEKQAADVEARRLDIRANDEMALAQRDMLQLNRQKNMALSSLQARAASSGFTATDPTTLAIADEIQRYGTLQEQMALFGGTVRADDMRFGADAKRYSGAAGVSLASQYGDAVRQNAAFTAAGTILGTMSSLAGRYGTSTPTGFSPYQKPGGPLVINRYG